MGNRRKQHYFGWLVGGTATLSLLLLALAGSGQQAGVGGAQTVHQQSFEGRDAVWAAGPADAKYKEIAHKIIDDPAAHGGQRDEYFQLQAEAGTFIHYTYDVGHAPVADDLSVSLFVKANRPGVQVLCRVVLPHERDPQHLDQVLTTVVRGETYELTGRWQQLRLRHPVKALREQQQLLQATLKREVNTTDAYVDRIILNVYGGPGLTEVWTDDLEAGPVLDARPAGPPTAQPTGRPAAGKRPYEVRLEGNKLLVGGKPFFLRAIRNTGAPLKALRDAGFNTVWLDETTPPDLIAHAVDLGFWIVPSLAAPEQPEGATAGQLAALNEGFGRKVSQYIYLDAVLGWDLGSNLQKEHYAKVSRTAQTFRNADPLRPLTADVWDGYQSYARDLDQQIMLGVHRWPLMTSLDLSNYKDWLVQRRRLAVPEPFCWTWIQTHLPDWYSTLVYGKTGATGYDEPIGPQAEQIRLMTYLAVGSGYRGVGYWSDRFLADSHTGRDRLLALAQLNQELEMLEPLLVNGEEPRWIDTNKPEVKAAVIRSEKAILVLPVWIGTGSQYVPGQSAVAKLDVLVPQVPPSMQPWEVSPGFVRSLHWKPQTGGVLVSVPEFSLTSAIVFTFDPGNPTGLVARFQEKQRRMSKVAAQWAHDQAEEEIAKVERVYAELDKGGHPLPDGQELLKKARGYLASCEELRRTGDYGEAYLEAQRAMRPLRIIMRAEWDKAVKELSTPVASPYALGYYTLPRHWEFWQDVQQRRAASNVLPDGDFEAANDQAPEGWLIEEVPSLDDVTVEALRVKDDPKVGKQCLMLKMAAKDGQLAPPVLERSYLAIHSPAVRLQPGTLVKISAWLKIPAALGATTDGALLFDSVGGEPLALRMIGPTKGWEKFTFYRKVPASGTLNVTMALQGLGKVYFDDVRVEPLTAR
jgi:hypothetical protein